LIIDFQIEHHSYALLVTKSILTKFAVIACFSSTLIISGSIHRAQAVTYGDPVLSTSSYPEVVAVRIYSTLSKQFVTACTGTLISQTEVLTAAHCIRGYNLFQVEVGSTAIGNGRIIGVRSSWFSSRYSQAKFANDIGILLLTEPANVPVLGRISPASFSPKTRTKYTLVGFGNDQNGDQGPMRVAKLRVQTKGAIAAYKKIFNQKTTIAAGRFLRSERVYAGACDGDSGGPLFSTIKGKRYVVGVTSYGSVSCEAAKPSVFARVGYYRKEIAKGRKILSRIANTPLQPLSLSLTSTTRSFYNSFTVNAATDQSGQLSLICVNINGITATYNEVTGDGSVIGWSPSNGCMSISGSLSSTGRLDFEKDVPLSQVSISIIDSLGRTTNYSFGQIAAATALTIDLTPTSGFSWERRFTVNLPNSPFLSPLRLCVTVNGRPATSSEVEGDVSKIPWVPTGGCFSSSSYYPINGGYIAFDKSALVGTHQIVVTVTDGLNRSQSSSFTFTGCTFPYSC
jgi:secreted trypsin-like serine protease